MKTAFSFWIRMFAVAGLAMVTINAATANERAATGASASGVMLAEVRSSTNGGSRDCPECDMPMRQHGQMKDKEIKDQHDMHRQMGQDTGNMNGSKSGMEHPMGMPPSNNMPSKENPDSRPTTDAAPDAPAEENDN